MGRWFGLILGPITIAMDGAPSNQWTGAILTIVLLPMILSVLIKPRVATLVISSIGLLIWMFLGEIGAGINC